MTGISLRPFFLTLMLVFISNLVWAANVIRQESVWGLAGANAFTACISGEEAIFYNPAALYNNHTSYSEQKIDQSDGDYPSYFNRIVTFKNIAVAQTQYMVSGNRLKQTMVAIGNRTQNFLWGVTYKTIEQGSARGWAIDTGILVPLSQDTLLGISGLNLFQEQTISINGTVSVGVSKILYNRALIVFGNLTYSPFQQSWAPSMAAAITTDTALHFRFGVTPEQYTGGVAFQLSWITIYNSMEVPFNSTKNTRYAFGFILGR